MSLRFKFLLWALLFSAVSLSAQVKKGFKLLEDRAFDEALICFQKDANTAGNSIPAGYGILKAAAGVKESSTWIAALSGYTKTLKDFTDADEKTQKKLNSEFKITKNAIEQAYNALFSKTLVFVEKERNARTVRDSFIDAVPVIPTQYKGRFNQLMIRQTTAPVTNREKLDPAQKSQKKSVYVDRKPPEGSNLEFVSGINTEGSEFVPVLSADGKTMYFVGSGRVDNYIGEDVYYTERQEDGSWAEPKLDEFFSGPTNEAVVSISADGNNLVLFIGGKPHISKRTEQGWSEPLPILLPKSFAWIGVASITRNGEALIFEAKEGPRSDIDIFIALRNNISNWSMPFALGNTVNSSMNERTPFLHSDFKTLYFSSEGHGGQGSFDVFKTTRLDDTWKSWSIPENLGPGVNTPKDEYGFYIPPAGNVAYLATRTGEFQDQDIMRIPLDAAARPEAQVIITGTLTDGNGKSFRGEITVEDAETQKLVQTVVTRPDGKYAFSIPKTAKINYYAKGDSLVSIKKTFVDASTYKSEVAEEKVEFVTVKEAAREGKALELKDLRFDFAKADLRPDAQSELKRIYADIKSFNWSIEIGGHTDNVGSEQSNLQLSTRRAQAVRDFLVAQGYSAEKISFKGYGSSVPISENDTEDGRAKNRRVEIKVKIK
ncbi:MAG: OmpA family protein [Saprospiraceae bacterium]|nr:OmpA family protein [Saprospiraceae bacterium]